MFTIIILSKLPYAQGPQTIDSQTWSIQDGTRNIIMVGKVPIRRATEFLKVYQNALIKTSYHASSINSTLSKNNRKLTSYELGVTHGSTEHH